MIMPLIRQSGDLGGLTTPNDKHDINPGPKCAAGITGVTLPEVVGSVKTEHVDLPTGQLQSVVSPVSSRGISPRGDSAVGVSGATGNVDWGGSIWSCDVWEGSTGGGAGLGGASVVCLWIV